MGQRLETYLGHIKGYTVNNAFIYSEVPMYSSVLGWILQQSPSYESEYFVFNNSIFNKSSRLDPWDNHSDDPDNWHMILSKMLKTKTYIKILIG